MTNLLSIENLAFTLPYRSILQPLSFVLNAGETVLVTGARGVGKTLLLRLLNRLTEPTQGTVYLLGQDYRTIALPQLRRQVAWVSAAPQLLGMTVQEALLYPLKLQKLPAPMVEERLVRLLGEFPLPEAWLSWGESQLSIDQCQRVAVARSLLLEPQVLLMDEPTQSLDAECWALVQKIARLRKIAMVVTGKPVEADRVLYLQAGSLVWERTTVNWEEVQAEIDQVEQAEADWS